MKKFFSLLLLSAALFCLPWSAKADPIPISPEDPYTQGFESDMNGYVSTAGTLSRSTTKKHSGSYSLSVSRGNGSTAVIVFPEFSDALEYLSVTFYAARQYTAACSIGYTTSTTDASKFVSKKNLTGDEFGTSFDLPVSYDFSTVEETIPDGARIAVRFTGTNSGKTSAFYMDDVTITSSAPAATCAKPTEINVSNVTTESAVISWTSEASKWNLEWKASDAEDWTSVSGLTEKTYTLESLSALTTYNVRVQADCGSEDGLSAFVSAEPFTTKLCTDENLKQVSYTFTDSYNDGWNGASLKIVHKATGNTLETLSLSNGESPKNGTLSLCCGEEYSIQWTAGSYPAECGFVLHDDFNDEDIVNYAQGSAPSSGTLIEYTIKCVKATCAKPTSLSATATYDGAVVTITGDADQYQYGVVANGAAEPTEWTLLDKDKKEVTVNGKASGTTYDIYVRSYCSSSEQSDAIKTSFTPNCPAPSFGASPVTEISASSATITWSAATDITKHQFVCVRKGETPNWEGVAEQAVTSVTLPDTLAAKTEYDFYVRSWYSAASQSTAIKTTFETECAAVNAPKTWNFEDGTSGKVPTCWSTGGTTSTTTESYLWSVVSAGGNKVLRMYNSMVKSGSVLINTPSIVMPAEALELAFEYSHKASCGAFTVKVSKDGGNNWTDLGSYANETGGNATTPGDYLDATLSLADYANETIILQFFATADWGSGAIFIDNVDIRQPITCPTPKNVLVSNVKDNSAVVAWTEKGTASAWKVQTSLDGVEWLDEKIVDADANPFTLTGLTVETTYYVRVKADCGGSDESAWSEVSAAFKTRCERVDMPLTEGFEENLSDCWTKPAQWTLSTTDPHAGEKCIRYNSASDADLVLPLVTLTDKAQLRFWRKSNYVSCSVYLNSVADENKLADFAATTKWTESVVDLSEHKDETVTLIIRGNKYSSYYNLDIDSLDVTYASVAAPTELDADPKDQGATITWESAEGASWLVRYREFKSEEPLNEWDSVEVNTKSHTLTGLTNGTEYEVQVQTIVNANRKSDWTASTKFTPAACPTVTEVTLGAKTYNSVVVNWTASATSTWALRYSTDGGENWLVASSAIENQTYTLSGLTTNTKYKIAVKPTCGDDEAWVVAAESFTPEYTKPVAAVANANITDSSAVATWSEVSDASGYQYDFVIPGAEAAWKETDEFTATGKILAAGTDYLFLVRSKYPTGDSEVDTAAFKTITYAPINLRQEGESTTTSATFKWKGNGLAEEWQWSIDGDTWNIVADSTVTVDGLSSGTAYTLRVRSYYNADVQSTAESVKFTTQCEAYDISYTQDFEDGGKPTCWVVADENWGDWSSSSGNKWSNRSGSVTHLGDYALYYNAKTSTANKADISMPRIALDNDVKLRFYFKNNSEVHVEVHVAAQDMKTDTTVLGSTGNNFNTLKEIDLSAFTGKTVTITFQAKGYSTSGSPYCAIDDISFQVIPCVTPTGLTATVASKTSAIISWTDNEATEWNLQYKADTTNAVWVPVNGLTDKTYTLNDLATDVQYEVQVQAVCSATRSSAWTASQTFTPSCPTPGEIFFTNAAYDSVVVNWTKGGAETAWNLSWETGTESGLIENITETNYTLKSLVTKVEYTIKVQATCDGDWSEAKFTPVYTKPVANAAMNITDNAADFSWSAVGDAEGYKFAVVRHEGTPTVWSDKTTELTAAVDTLAAATEYDLYVAAVYGEHLEVSDAKSFTTITYAPQNIVQGATTTTSATFTWEKGGNEVGYQWRVDEGEWSDKITTLSTTVNELTAGTAYTFYVRSVYANDAVSATPASLPFTTACASYAVGYTQDFETGSKPICWVVDDENWADKYSDKDSGNKWSVRSGSTTHGGSYALYYNARTSTTNSADITLPQIVIDQEAKLFFYIKNNAYLTGEVRVAATDVETSVTALANTSANFNTLQTIDLTAFIGKTVTITFHAQGAGSSDNASLAIDDIEIAGICQKPTITTVTPTLDGAVVTWSGDEDQYQYCVVGEGSEAYGWTLLKNGVKTVVITGKSSSTSYDIYVRAYCSEANQSEAAKETFATQTPTGMGEINGEDKNVVKIIENGVLYIIRDGVKYNAQGAVVK